MSWYLFSNRLTNLHYVDIFLLHEKWFLSYTKEHKNTPVLSENFKILKLQNREKTGMKMG